jgi:hypothetical protein
MNSLVKYWNECDSKGPYVHPADEKAIGKEAEFSDRRLLNHRKFIDSDRFGLSGDKTFHLSLLPVPYQGNLATADIFLLFLNPGLGLNDYYTDDDKLHSERHRRIIRQDLDGVDYPYLSLDPLFSWSGGFQYWEKKLRKHLRAVADERFGGHYVGALKHLGSRLATIEIVPYHSARFGAGRLIAKMPSAGQATSFVWEHLVPKAKAGAITLIATRQIKMLNLPENCKDIVVYKGPLARGAHLGPGTPGGDAISRRLKYS